MHHHIYYETGIILYIIYIIYTGHHIYYKTSYIIKALKALSRLISKTNRRIFLRIVSLDREYLAVVCMHNIPVFRI